MQKPKPMPKNGSAIVVTTLSLEGNNMKRMKYKITYKHRSGRDKNKWTVFTEILDTEEMYSCVRWIEKNSEDHTLISVAPL